MNSNIQKLFDDVHTTNYNRPELIEEIADAIVKECARVCEELQFSAEGPTPEARYQRVLCADAIKKHFGVY